MLFNSFKSNKLTIIAFFTITTLGYFSLPHLEKYHATLKKENKLVKEDDKEQDKKEE
tara:strand:+ start:292 stop:462 length:171 start_codon:yes stop_codon:yes gene_type:complete